MNVPLGSKEPSEALLSSHFYDPYNESFEGTVDERNSTCTYYFTNYLFSENKNVQKIDPQFQILDYSLLWKPQMQSFVLSTKRISMNDLKKPKEAMSDHHGLLSVLEKIPEKSIKKN